MLRLSLFGGLRLSVTGVPHSAPSVQPRRFALLALLAASGDAGLSRDKLTAYLWPELSDERARHTLRQAIYALRSALGASALIEGATALALNPIVISSDVADFESALALRQWENAVACYAGPFLDGFFIQGAQEFEDWVARERSRFEQSAAAAFEQLGDDATSRTEHQQALNWYRRLFSIDPLNSRSALKLASAMASAGDVPGALRSARGHQELRRDEVGAGPDPAIDRLTQRLLTAPPLVASPTTPRPTLSSSDALVTALQARWEIECTLEQRASASVFLAREIGGTQPIVLRVLSPTITRLVNVDALTAQLHRVIELDDAGLIPLLEVGTIGDLVYLMTPVVHGATVRERLARERQLPIADVVDMARATASALAHAHTRQVLHLDIRPKYIVQSASEYRLAEIGIASAIRAALATEGHRTGLTLGAPAYMSPEQAAGDPAIDARSDLYSLGCLLYEALIGEPPLTAATPQALMMRRLSESVSPLRPLRDTVPLWLESIVMQLLARAPADRFHSADELLSAMPAPLVATDPERFTSASGATQSRHSSMRPSVTGSVQSVKEGDR